MSSLKTRSSKCIAAVMACALTLTSMAGADVQAAKKAKAKLAKTKLTVKVGEKVTIKLKKRLKKAKYTYVSKNTKIATVSKKGKVKGIKKGSAKIAVTEKVGKKKYKVGTVKVTVTKKGSTTTTTTPTVNPAASAPASSLAPSAPAATAPSGTVTSAPASSEPTSGVATSKPTSPSKSTKKPPTTKAPTPTPIIKPDPIEEEESKVETYAVDFAADVKLDGEANATVETGDVLKAKFNGGFEGFHVILPDTDDIKGAKFKYVTITYKSTDAGLSLYLYDDTIDLANPDLSRSATGKYERKIGLEKTGDQFKTVTITVADQFQTGEGDSMTDVDLTKKSFRGLQLFGWQATTELTVNSIVFSAKEPKSSLDLSTIPEVEGVVYDEASGELKVADGVAMFRVPLPADIIGEGENIVKVPKDKMVSVTIKGRLSEESTGFRFWLCEGDPDATASDQYHFTKNQGIGFGGRGDGDIEFNTGEFTCKAILLCGGEGSKNFAADSLTIKGPVYGEMMTGVTITSIEARLVES